MHLNILLRLNGGRQIDGNGRREFSSWFSKWFFVTIAGRHVIVVVGRGSNRYGSLIARTLGSGFLGVRVLSIDSLGFRFGRHGCRLRSMTAEMIHQVRRQLGPWSSKVARRCLGRKVVHGELFVEIG
jgi:hypothetical protein